MTVKTRRFLIALVFLAITLFVFKNVMLYCQSRSGVVIPDPLQALFSPLTLHVPIFIITYAPILFGVFILIKKGKKEELIYGYGILQIFRMTSIFLIPLEAPPAMITLNDPVADHLVFGSVVTKDLFFSGHVSALTLFSLYMPTRKLTWIFRILAATDAVLLTAQHVHYTADVVFAPCFAYLAFRLQKRYLPQDSQS